MSGDDGPPESTSAFKDKLAQWNKRDENTDSSALDIVRVGKSSDFVRLGAKKRFSMDHSSSGGNPAISKGRSSDISEDGVIMETPDITPTTGSPHLLSPVRVATKSSSTSNRDKNSSRGEEKEEPIANPLLQSPGRSRLQQRTRNGKASSRKLRMESIRAVPLEDLNIAEGFTSPVIQKSAEAEAVLRAALQSNFVFEKLVPAAVDHLINAFEPTCTYNHDDIIIQQGDKGDFFYVIEQGEVSFEVNGKVVGSAKHGASFGELALLYTCPRAATVKATTTTTLWRLEQTVFRYVLQNKTQESKIAKYDLLKNIDFFRQMEKSDLQRCINVMTPRKYEKGEFIVRKGEDGDAFYVVESGELKVTEISVGDAKYEDVTLGPGDFFGERALVKKEPRAANVIGVTAGTLFSIDRETFVRVCGSLVRLILKSQDKSRLSGLNVVHAAKLDAESIAQLTQFLEDEMYRKGKKIFVEGRKTKPAVYLVREGKIKLTFSDGEEKIIKEGGYFGEDHLLADAKGIVLSDGFLSAKYSATALEQNSICAVLSLSDCRKVFDTKNIELSDELKNESFLGMVEDEDEEFRSLIGRRSSRRSTLNVETLRASLQLTTVLGEGQFGKVWEATTDLSEFSDSSKFALKIQAKDDSNRVSYSSIQAIKRECQILSSMDHPFIVDLVSYYEDEKNIYMVMGIIPGGDLWAVIHKEMENGGWSSGIPESHAKFYTLILVDTLHYMHRRKIAFRDLKLENIMVDIDGYPIIVDFGFAKQLNDGVTYTFCGTPQHMAPEICANTGHGFAVDHWAMGCLIYEMVSGENPFYYEGVDNLSLFNDICTQEPYPLPEDVIFSDEVRDLIDRLLVKDPTQRIGSLAEGNREIKMHPWFDGLDLEMARDRKLKAPFTPKLDSLKG